jgi:transcriptional regulator
MEAPVGEKTVRQEIIDLLSMGEEHNARSISQIIRVSEKEVCDHLLHIDRSLAATQRKLLVIPARCLKCGYTFKDRVKFSKPARCPRCREEHLEDPRYQVV